MKFGEAPFLFKEIYGEREQKPQDGPAMSSSLSDQNSSKEKRDGYWPMSFIINSPFSWARKFLLQLIKEKSQAANFFIINLLSCLSELIKLMYNFLKFIFFRYSYIFYHFFY